MIEHYCLNKIRILCRIIKTKIRHNNNNRYPYFGINKYKLTELSPTINQTFIIRAYEKVTYMLIDVAISGDRNVTEKEAEKILKYKDLTLKIQRMWNVKTWLIPVITGATGPISKSFRKYVSNIPGKHEVKELQKTDTLGTAHILRKLLM
jgi:hypothetical protein